jgi:hypothetical protein
MNLGFAKPVLCCVLAPWLVFVACSTLPSRAPLGGNYALSASEPARDRQAQVSDAGPSSEPSSPRQPAPAANVALETPVADAGLPVPDRDLLRYDPLKTGDQVKGELSVFFSAALEHGGQGVLPGNGFVTLDTKFRIELKVVRASAQSLDELELKLTPLSLHTDFGGRSSDMPQVSVKTFDITLGGRSPNVRERAGAPLTAEERAMLMLFVTPLTDFHERWSHSPTLELKSGWSSKVPVTVPSFMSTSSDTMHIGPFVARYSGRDPNSDQVPFQVTLPIEYGTDLGKLSFELSGTARLSADKARPVSIDLSGPVSGGAGPHGEVSFHGTAKIAATLGYP